MGGAVGLVSSRTIADMISAHIMATRPPEKRDLDVGDRSQLVATGILDSVGVFDLVAFLEERFEIEVADNDLEWNNFETIEAITRLVESKLAGAGPDAG